MTLSDTRHKQQEEDSCLVSLKRLCSYCLDKSIGMFSQHIAHPSPQVVIGRINKSIQEINKRIKHKEYFVDFRHICLIVYRNVVQQYDQIEICNIRAKIQTSNITKLGCNVDAVNKCNGGAGILTKTDIIRIFCDDFALYSSLCFNTTPWMDAITPDRIGEGGCRTNRIVQPEEEEEIKEAPDYGPSCLYYIICLTTLQMMRMMMTVSKTRGNNNKLVKIHHDKVAHNYKNILRNRSVLFEFKQFTGRITLGNFIQHPVVVLRFMYYKCSKLELRSLDILPKEHDMIMDVLVPSFKIFIDGHMRVENDSLMDLIIERKLSKTKIIAVLAVFYDSIPDESRADFTSIMKDMFTSMGKPLHTNGFELLLNECGKRNDIFGRNVNVPNDINKDLLFASRLEPPRIGLQHIIDMNQSTETIITRTPAIVWRLTSMVSNNIGNNNDIIEKVIAGIVKIILNGKTSHSNNMFPQRIKPSIASFIGVVFDAVPQHLKHVFVSSISASIPRQSFSGIKQQFKEELDLRRNVITYIDLDTFFINHSSSREFYNAISSAGADNADMIHRLVRNYG